MALRHAVIGCGMVAGYGHLPAVDRCEGLELSAVCDRDAARRNKAAEQCGVPGFAEVGEMLDAVELDSATVCTTLPTHREVALQVVEAGLHCFCEKPMAGSADDCDAMVDAFEAAGRVLAVNFEFRFNPLLRGVKADIEAGRIGALQSLRWVFNWDNHWHREEIRPRRAAFLGEGFGSMDCGVHYLDLTRWLTGAEFARVASEGLWVEPQYTYPGHIHIIGRLDNGVAVSMEESFTYTLGSADALCLQYYDFAGDEGVIHVRRPMDGTGGMVVHRHFPTETRVEQVADGKPWDAAYAEFARVAAANSFDGSDLASGRDGAAAIRLIEQIIEQCRAGRHDIAPAQATTT